MASYPIYQIESKLVDTTVRRRFEVSGHITVARLAYILMTMYEMQASHMFSFEIGSRTWNEESNIIPMTISYELPDEDEIDWSQIDLDSEDIDWDAMASNKVNAKTATIGQLFRTEGSKAAFLYDYGDGWEVSLECQKIIRERDIPGKLLPRVLDGEGYGIIEDCGGPEGLKRLERAFQKKSGKAYREYSEWLGTEELDLMTFDIEDMNFRLKKIPRIYQDIYEHDLEPTDSSYKILTRAYKKKK